MVDLFCTPFAELLLRMRLEFQKQQAMFDLPRRRWFVPGEHPSSGAPATSIAPDLSVRFHDQLAGNPLGPASGPQTQMAQNLVLSWLAGSRIMELKTVQINDELKISRPCIDAANLGYNVEWSQELRVAESLDQYVQGAMLIHMLRHAPEEFGRPFGDVDMSGPSGATVYDMSIGYDLAGIQSPKVVEFIRGMIDARPSVERLREHIPQRLGRLRDLDYPINLSRSITLSTFHGCPADEIEKICAFLLTELDVHVIVKMNPPMLGQERLEHLLYDVMGYTDLRVNPKAYSSGLQFNESLEICSRLTALAHSRGLQFGAKFSNTLEVENHRSFFQPTEKIMYLSGAPLHVITLTLAGEFRKAVGAEFPISFSAGVDRKNAANLIACGFAPVTTCTDLLKTGGYGRLPPYLHELAQQMDRVGASSISDFILDARGQRTAANGDPVQAGFLNTSIIVAETQADRRYHAAHNRAVPKKIDSHLVTFDCITCDKCIPVCPNDANFTYRTGTVRRTYRDIEVRPDGSIVPVGDERTFELTQADQIANFADYCNHCGNCDTFCPELDGPYLKKPNFYGSRRAFEAGAPHDGFLIEGVPGALTLRGRIEGRVVELRELPGGAGYHYANSQTEIQVAMLDDATLAVSALVSPSCMTRVDIGRFNALVTLLRGVSNLDRIHAINVPLIVPAD